MRRRLPPWPISLQINGKLDYPARVLRYMQDPALHGLIYSSVRPALAPLI